MSATAALVALTAFGTGISAYSAMKPGPKAPRMPGIEESAAAEASAAQASAQAQALALQRRRGIASTMLTGPQGLLGGESVRRPTLGA